ncbi:MAG: cupin, partial [Thiotrichales bacterium]|nr:cupin [Thiotrichales bacterium]
MKINNIEGEVVKDNDVYILKDNTDLKSLVL